MKRQTRRKAGTQSHGTLWVSRAANDRTNTTMQIRVSHLAHFLILVAVAVPALTMGGTAYALAAPASAPAPLTVAQDGSITGLVPGGPAQPITYTITNPGSAARSATGVRIALTSVSYVAAAGTGVGVTWRDHPAGGPAPGCTAADFTIVQPAPLSRELPAGASFTAATTDRSGTIRMNNLDRNQDDCRGTMARLSLTIG